MGKKNEISAQKRLEITHVFNKIAEIMSQVEKTKTLNKNTMTSLFQQTKTCFELLKAEGKVGQGVDDYLDDLIQKSWPFLKEHERLGHGLALTLQQVQFHKNLSKSKQLQGTNEAFDLLRAFMRVNEINHSQYINCVNFKEESPSISSLEKDKMKKIILDKGWNLSSSDITDIYNHGDPAQRKNNTAEINAWAVYTLLTLCDKTLLHLTEVPDPDNLPIIETLKKMLECLSDPTQNNTMRLQGFSKIKLSMNYKQPSNSFFQAVLTEIEQILDVVTKGGYSNLMKKDVWREAKCSGFFGAATKVQKALEDETKCSPRS
ncbi:hypothetical protein [Legionella sp.]|uniref:hypothetical protein n=1 Tax=Legionella sp. TaxID=459 RepID=UPI0032209B83